MSNINPEKPVILVLAGHDPSGGAGIQADIESIASAGCHPVCIITSLTTQNTKTINGIYPQNPDIFRNQLRLIMDDIEISACKIGMIGDQQLVDIIYSEINGKRFPVVLDPVIRSESDHELANDVVIRKITEKLVPTATLVTPNSDEARKLAATEDLDKAAKTLLSQGCKHALITGTHENTNNVINTLYSHEGPPVIFEFDRLDGQFHGSGCTLSSSIAANLALGMEITSAVENSLKYTWTCLKNAINPGSGNKIPDRTTWLINNINDETG